jgi:hypothetical protein
MLLLTPSVSGLFKWRQFEPEMIRLRSRLLLNGKLVEAGTIFDCGLIPGRFLKLRMFQEWMGEVCFL